MSLKFSSLAPAIVALGLAGFAIPTYALTPEEPEPTAAPVQPACEKGFIYDTRLRNCVAENTVVKCDAGFTYDPNRRECVRSTALNDADLFYQGRLLALSGHYESALDTLGTIGNKTSNVLTMIGYSTRKLGNIEEGISIYHRALALDPANLNTHEYLGEGYLAQGRVDLAEAQLSTLRSLCGTACVQYRALSDAIYQGAWN
jgi:tetratricopeptide (TPR) repeat protein